MKTVRLLIILLGLVLVFAAVYAMKTEEVKVQEKSPLAEKAGDAKAMPRMHNDANWSRRSYEPEQAQGMIRTH